MSKYSTVFKFYKENDILRVLQWEGEKKKMSHSQLKGFICRDDAGIEYTVIEYRQPKPQTTNDNPSVLNETGNVRFFRTSRGLDVIRINSTTFKIVKSDQLIKSNIPI